MSASPSASHRTRSAAARHSFLAGQQKFQSSTRRHQKMCETQVTAQVFEPEMPAVPSYIMYMHNLKCEIFILLKPQMNIKLR